jgi:hypothetical protein
MGIRMAQSMTQIRAGDVLIAMDMQKHFLTGAREVSAKAILSFRSLRLRVAISVAQPLFTLAGSWSSTNMRSSAI